MYLKKNLTHYLVEQQREHNVVTADVRLLLETVARACKAISHAVSKGALGGVLGSLDSENVQGEVQKNWMSSQMISCYKPMNGVVI